LQLPRAASLKKADKHRHAWQQKLQLLQQLMGSLGGE